MNTDQITVANIKCGGCVSTIKNELLKLEGVLDVSIESNTVSVTYDQIERHAITQKLELIGYPVVS